MPTLTIKNLNKVFAFQCERQAVILHINIIITYAKYSIISRVCGIFVHQYTPTILRPLPTYKIMATVLTNIYV